MSGQLEFGEEDHTATLGRAWELALHLLASKVSEVAFATYIQPIQPLSYIGSVVTLGIANAFFRERLEKNHANSIRSALEFHLDTTGLRIVFVVLSREQQRSAETKRADVGRTKAGTNQTALPLDVDATAPVSTSNSPASLWASARTQGTKKDKTEAVDTPFPAPATNSANNSAPAEQFPPVNHSKIENRKSKIENSPSAIGSRQSSVPPPTGKPNVHRASQKGRSESQKSEEVPIPTMPLNDRYVFETFLEGKSNRLAHAGATAVAEHPGEKYNPLFLYGGPGLGKTHLMHSIAHRIRERQPEARIAYVSGEYFAQHYITAIRDHATEDFRRQYRQVDVWLVDDIQFVAGKEHTKEEFFHTFNTLYQGGKQIVIASDRSPRELNTMDERLRSRFQSGLIADINAPELETRVAILQQWRRRDGFVVEDSVLDYIASAIQSNMRALEGALTKLVAYSSIHNTSATAELAQSVLSEYFIEKPIPSRKISLNDIVDTVAPFFGVSAIGIKGPNRNKDVSLARQVAMYLCRELLPELNTTVVGAAFGSRDHATIVYACQRVKGLMELDAELKTLVQQVQKRLSV